MKKKLLIIFALVIIITVVVIIITMNKPYDRVSFVADAENWSASVTDGGSLILDIENSNKNNEWSIIQESELFASDYQIFTENIAEFHIIALNDGEGEMVFQCLNNDGTTDKYLLSLSISRHKKRFLQIDSVSFAEYE